MCKAIAVYCCFFLSAPFFSFTFGFVSSWEKKKYLTNARGYVALRLFPVFLYQTDCTVHLNGCKSLVLVFSRQGLYFGGSCQMFLFMTLDFTFVFIHENIIFCTMSFCEC